jgi:hypothetical protein
MSEDVEGVNGVMTRVHRSLLVSISPNNSLLPPLFELAADVADAADEMEKDDDGLLARTNGSGLSCLLPILKK